jgi:WD40 repeat protein
MITPLRLVMALVLVGNAHPSSCATALDLRLRFYECVAPSDIARERTGTALRDGSVFGADSRVRAPWIANAPIQRTASCRSIIEIDEPRLLKGHKALVTKLAFSLDKTVLATASEDCDVYLWDVQTSRHICELKGLGCRTNALVFSPDGHQLAVGCNDGTIHVFGLAANKKSHQFQKDGSEVTCLAFSPDGRTLASGNVGGIICIWDVAREKLLRNLKGHDKGIGFLRFCSDQKLLSGGDRSVSDGSTTLQISDNLRIWDLATEKQYQTLAGQSGAGVVSPNGKIVISSGVSQRAVEQDAKTLTVAVDRELVFASTTTGREVYKVSKVSGDLALSADARLLTVSASDATVRLFEVATGREVLAIPIRQGWSPTNSLSADGQMLAAAHTDGSLRIWDLRLSRVLNLTAPKNVTSKVLRKCWNDLAAEEAGPAYGAIWVLCAVPQESVPFLNRLLQPAEDKGLLVEHLVANLNSENYRLREKSMYDLQELAATAEMSVRPLLKESSLSLEVRKRIESVLLVIERLQKQPEQLRRLRGIAALEQIGTKEARRVLQRLADGWSAADQTQEARESLRRLQKGGKT